jgi:DNA polymerase III subunit beta
MKTTYLKQLKKVAKRASLAIIDEAILIRDGWATATNLEVTLSVKTDIQGTGVISLNELIALKEYDKAWIEEQTLFVQKGSVTMKLAAVDAKDFPETPVCETPAGKFTDMKALKSLIGFAGNDDLRPQFNGYYFGEDHLVATDAHVMRWIKKKNKTPIFIMPKLVANCLTQEEYKIFIRREAEGEDYSIVNVMFHNYAEKVTFRVIDARFPNYQAVIPQENPVCAEVNTAELLAEIENAKIFANKQTHQGIFSLKGNTMKIESFDIDFGKEYQGEVKLLNNVKKPLRIGFSLNYLSRILTKEDKTTLLAMSDPNRAMLINNDTLIMPVMIQEMPDPEPEEKPVYAASERIDISGSEAPAEPIEESPIKGDSEIGKISEVADASESVVVCSIPKHEPDPEPETRNPEPETQNPEPVTPNLIVMENITDRAFAIVGSLDLLPEDFRAKYGSPTKLKIGDDRLPGLMFSKKRRDALAEMLTASGIQFLSM